MSSYTTTASNTYSVNNSVTMTTIANMVSGLPIVFSGNVFGNITANATYYIGNILSSNQINITSLPGGAIYQLANGSGTMTVTFSSAGQYVIDTVPPGDPLDVAFNKTNLNFDQIFAAGPVGSNIQIADNTIRTLNTNGNLVLSPNGIGNVVSNVNILPNVSNIRNLGSPTRRWNTVYAQYIDYKGGNITFSNISITGNIDAGGYISATGNVTGDYFIGNGSLLTGISGGGNASYIANGNSYANVVAVDGNVVIGANGNLWNFDTTGNLSAPGNVTANYFLGNGSQLTGINASSNKIVNGGSYANIADPNSNLEININSHSWVFDSAGTLSFPAIGNVTDAAIAYVANDEISFGTGTGNISIWPGTGHWVFDTAGNLTLPGNGEISINYANGSPYGSGAQGATGSQGLDGTQGTTGTQGATGAGVQGVQGATGTQGIQGVDGAQGIQGVQGTTGIQGVQGAVGAQGTDGAQGTTGTQGAVGADGAQGTVGNDGAQGTTGTGAQGTTGTQGTTGIQGTTGADGTSVRIIGSIATVGVNPQATLNAAFPGAVAGDGVIATDTGNLWVYSGSVWNNVGQIQGPQGITGTQGITGAQGTSGLDGAQGTTGTTGAQGTTGTTGAQGTTGADGAQGATGAQGVQGVDGAQGTQGVQGATGAQGVQGTTGIQGVQGATGYFDGNLTANLDGQGFSISNVSFVSATGNIGGAYILGNGSQLTGINTTANTGNITFSNTTISSNVANANIYLQPPGTGLVILANTNGGATGIQMGTPSAGNLVSNAVTLTTGTSVTNGIAQLNYVLGKLVPAAPPNFPGGNTLTLTMATTTARMCSGFTQPDNTATGNRAVAAGTAVAVTRNGNYTTNTISNTGPGDSGTLTAYRNGAAVGNASFYTNASPTANGTYGGNLVVTNNFDYHVANASITAGFWYVFSAAVSGASAPSGWNEIYMGDNVAGNTNTPYWYYDSSTAAAPQFSSTTFAACASPSLTYTSTIPHYNTGTNFNLGFLVNRLSANMYPDSNNLTSATSAGGAFAAPATITYASANITTPLSQNYLVSSGNATANTTAAIISGFGSSASGPTVTVTNSYNATTNTFTPSGTVLYKTGNVTAIDEGNIVISANTTGSGSAVGYRIVNPGTGNTPTYTGSEAQFNSQTGPLQTYDAVVVGSGSAGVLKYDVTNYSTGYLPAGPNLSGQGASQYFTFKFTRTPVSQFAIRYLGTVAGMWVALPGSVIDSTSTLNGWIDMTQNYAGAGVPGANTGAGGNGSNGCASGGAVIPNTAQSNVSKIYTCTFGTVSSSSATNNEIYVRILLTSGQSVTALNIQAAP